MEFSILFQYSVYLVSAVQKFASIVNKTMNFIFFDLLTKNVFVVIYRTKLQAYDVKIQLDANYKYLFRPSFKRDTMTFGLSSDYPIKAGFVRFD